MEPILTSKEGWCVEKLVELKIMTVIVAQFAVNKFWIVS